MSMTSEYGSTRSLSALFDTRDAADRAVAALQTAGIADVVLTGGDNAGYGSVARDVRADVTDRDRGFFEQLGDFFFPDEDRYTYTEGLSRGGFLVTVDNIPADQYDRALDILDDEGAVDLDAREAEWRSEGWSTEHAATTYGRSTYGSTATDASVPGTAAFTARDEGLPGTVASRTMDRAADALSGDYRDEGLPGTVASRTVDRAADALTGDRVYDDRDLNRDGVIDVAEERIYISKREHDLGRVRVRSYVKEIPVEESVNLREERVSIERRPVDRAATDADFRDQSVEAREYAEEAVVNKEARVVEEIALRKDATSRDEVVHDTVRKTEVEVVDERDGMARTTDRIDDKL